MREGRRLGCAAVAGPTELIERHDTEAVLLLDRQWFRLWPLEAACQKAKPTFCCDTLERDDANADALYRWVQGSALPVMMVLPLRYTPAVAKLQELLEERAARPRLVVCSMTTSCDKRPSNQEPDRAAGLWPGLLTRLDWCASLLPGAPTRILAAGLPGGGLVSVLMDYGDGRAVQLNRSCAPGLAPACRVDVLTDRGTAVVRLPNRVRWTDAQGEVRPRIENHGPLAQTLLEQFHQAVTEGRPPFPDLGHAYRLLVWWRLARRSYRESRWAEVPGGTA
jgi:predicted dehydrogenase